jgi:hypothetical protein
MAALFLLFFISPAAKALEVVKSADRITLKEIPCAQSMAEMEALRQWTLSTGANCGAMPMRKAGAFCEIEIGKCLPAHVKKYQNVKAENIGPNCWNLALVMKDFLPYLRMSSNEEMTFFMNSGLCKQVPPSEKPKPGDVGAIRETGPSCEDSNSACEVHGFIYVSENLAYSKNGYDPELPYQLQDRAKMNSAQGAWPGTDLKTEYYRCQSFKDYVAKAKISAEFRKAFATLDYAECQVSSASLYPKIFSEGEKRNISDAFELVASFLRKEFTHAQNTDEAFLYEALLVRLRGMNEQIQLFPSQRVNPGFPQVGPILDQALMNRFSK